MRKRIWMPALIGAAAGAINGVFGAGGGMVLVPLLRRFCGVEERSLYSTALAVMLPVSGVSLLALALRGGVDVLLAGPYCVGGVLGGLIAGLLYQKVPVRALHVCLGLLILWGGVRQFL